MSAPNFSQQAAQSQGYPAITFGHREQQLFVSIKAYVDSLSPDTVITTQGDIIIGNVSGNAARLAKGATGLPLVAGASTVSYAQLGLAGLAPAVAPSHVVKFAAQHTTAGGAAAEAITVTGALNTDLAFVQLVNDGTNNVSVLSAAVTADTLTVTFSADPGADAVINYEILRATS